MQNKIYRQLPQVDIQENIMQSSSFSIQDDVHSDS